MSAALDRTATTFRREIRSLEQLAKEADDEANRRFATEEQSAQYNATAQRHRDLIAKKDAELRHLLDSQQTTLFS